MPETTPRAGETGRAQIALQDLRSPLARRLPPERRHRCQLAISVRSEAKQRSVQHERSSNPDAERSRGFPAVGSCSASFGWLEKEPLNAGGLPGRRAVRGAPGREAVGVPCSSAGAGGCPRWGYFPIQNVSLMTLEIGLSERVTVPGGATRPRGRRSGSFSCRPCRTGWPRRPPVREHLLGAAAGRDVGQLEHAGQVRVGPALCLGRGGQEHHQAGCAPVGVADAGRGVRDPRLAAPCRRQVPVAGAGPGDRGEVDVEDPAGAGRGAGRGGDRDELDRGPVWWWAWGGRGAGGERQRAWPRTGLVLATESPTRTSPAGKRPGPRWRGVVINR